MGKITVETCEIEGLKIITPEVHGDARGYFMETYQYEDFKAAGLIKFSYRITSLHLLKESLEGFISRLIIRRISLSGLYRERYMMWL